MNAFSTMQMNDPQSGFPNPTAMLLGLLASEMNRPQQRPQSTAEDSNDGGRGRGAQRRSTEVPRSYKFWGEICTMDRLESANHLDPIKFTAAWLNKGKVEVRSHFCLRSDVRSLPHSFFC